MMMRQATTVVLAISIAIIGTAGFGTNSLAQTSVKRPPARQAPATAQIVDGEILVEYTAEVLHPEGPPIPPPPGGPGIGHLPEGPAIIHPPGGPAMIAREKRMNLAADHLKFRHRVTVLSTHPASGIQRMKVPQGETVATTINKLKADPLVKIAEPNYKIYLETCSTPPSDSPECAPPKDGHWRAGHLWGMKKIGMRDAWNVPTGPGVVVAVIDSGIDYDHPDLKQNMWVNPGENPKNIADPNQYGQIPDQVDNDGNGIVDDVHGADFCMRKPDPRDPTRTLPTGKPMDEDPEGHGTMVAGIIAAVRSDWNGTLESDSNKQWFVKDHSDTGLVGVNYSAKLMALKFNCLTDPKDPTGKPYGSYALAIEAIDYAREHGARVLNNSWVVPGVSQKELQLLEKAIRRANCEPDELTAASLANCQPALFVASAGNSLSDNDEFDHYPSNFAKTIENVIAVAATDEQDDLWIEPCSTGTCGSNRGATTVHIAAPGANILSTYLRDREGGGGKGVDYNAGTSMAAPRVAGCAALLQAKRLATPSPPLLPKDLKEILMSTGDPLSSLVDPTTHVDKVVGHRRLNCAKAMAR